MKTVDIVVYGANGYSGELITEYAVEQGYKPLLAGRSEHKLAPIAERQGLEYRVVDVADARGMLELTRAAKVVINCAGPFSQTAEKVITACIAGKAHYLDITGEVGVFEWAHNPAVSERAAKAGVVVCPGTGFDVVPTDCLAATLKAALPSATQLELAFASTKQLSQGTAKTMMEGLGQGGASRYDGKIVSEPVGQTVKAIDFGHHVGEKTAFSIPWGDISTAYTSTGIENIKVFIPGTKKAAEKARKAYKLRWLFKRGFVQNYLKKRVEKTVTPPNEEVRTTTKTVVWGRVEDANGESKEATFITSNGYDLTMRAPVMIAKALIESDEHQGSMTPSQLMGADFVWKVDGVEEIEWR